MRRTRPDEASISGRRSGSRRPATERSEERVLGHFLALEAIEQRLASLDDAGRRSGACGRIDPVFSPGTAHRSSRPDSEHWLRADGVNLAGHW